MNELNRFVNETIEKLEVDIDDYSKNITKLKKEIDVVKFLNKALLEESEEKTKIIYRKTEENDELMLKYKELQHEHTLALEKLSKIENAGSSTSTYMPSDSLVTHTEQLDDPGNMHKYTFLMTSMLIELISLDTKL